MMALLARAKHHRRKPRAVAIDRLAVTALGLAMLAMGEARAQPDPGGASSRGFSFTPSINATETLTNNAELTATDRRPDLITQVGPALQVRGVTDWVQGFLDYSLVGLTHARGTSSDSIQQSLGTAFQAQGLDHHLFVNARASISRENVSALGTQASDAALDTGNQTQVASFDVAPSLRGALAGVVAYSFGADYNVTHSGAGEIGNSTNKSEFAHLGTASSTQLIGWGLDVSHDDTDFSLGRQTTDESAVGSLVLTPDGELQFVVRGGREGNDVQTLKLKYDTTYGASVRWMPSERTTIQLQDDKRYFGNAYTLNFQHRTAQTVWTISDVRQVVNDTAGGAEGQPMSAFDLLYLQLASKYPDPVVRASQALLELQALGLNPLVTVPAGFLTNAVSLQRSLTGSVGYIGLRNSVVLSAAKSDISRLDPLSGAVDSLSAGGTIRQRSFSLSATHRLTPVSSLNLTLSDSRTLGSGTSGQVTLRSVTADWATQVGLRGQFSLGARRTISFGESPYTESALLATFSLQI